MIADCEWDDARTPGQRLTLDTLVQWQAQQAGLCVVLATIPPRDDFCCGWQRDAMEPERQILNAHIRATPDIDGIVDFGPSVRGKRCIVVRDTQTNQEEEHLIPIGKHVIVFKGDFVRKGQQLTEGPMDPHEILEVLGPHELQSQAWPPGAA